MKYTHPKNIFTRIFAYPPTRQMFIAIMAIVESHKIRSDRSEHAPI